MRFLIDNALSPALARLLREAGHDCVHVRDRNLQRETDAAVFELAVAERRVLLSADTDFARILALRRARIPSLVLLRAIAHRPGAQSELLLAHLAEIAPELGSIVVLEDARVRVRELPVGPL